MWPLHIEPAATAYKPARPALPSVAPRGGPEVCVLKIPVSAQFPLVIVGLALVFAGIGHLTVGEGSPADPLPFDPLSEAEQDAALDIALADPVVASELSDHYIVIGASLNTDKEAMLVDEPPRRADVQIYDYASNRVVFAIVDLDANAVAQLLPVPHYQPPLVGAEIERAAELAAGYPGVDGLIQGEEIHRISHLWTGPGSGCPATHRCVTVGHYVDDQLDFSFFVLVDLSEDRVIELIENDWWTEEADS